MIWTTCGHYITRIIEKLKKIGESIDEEGKKGDIEHLRRSVSASFAGSILIIVITVGLCWIIYLVKGYQIPSSYALEINLTCYGLIITMLIYLIVAIFGIVSDMFSISRI